jgi:Predicted Zn-dependent protease (DUF2268)
MPTWFRIAALSLLSFACPGQSPNPVLISSDIDNFWRAYDAGQPGDRRDAFQTMYFDAASPGLKDFIALRIGSAAALASAVDAFPKFYTSIRKNTLQIESKRDLIQHYFARLQGLYPDAQIPPVYFVIGRLSSGGTLGQAGLYIGTEVFSLGGDADTSELKERIPVFLRAMGTIDKLPLIVVHEAIHAQVRRTSKPNLPDLLLYALLEGAADYLTNLVAGRNINDYKLDWIEPRRDELFRQFAKDLTDAPDSVNRWLYNYNSEAVSADTPADLGYWIGEEICRDYFNRAKDKQAAINNVASLSDPEAIIRGSAYAWILPQK